MNQSFINKKGILLTELEENPFFLPKSNKELLMNRQKYQRSVKTPLNLKQIKSDLNKTLPEIKPPLAKQKKETIHQLVKKKKEILLVRMAINYKKREQAKLEGLIEQQEAHLKKKEKVYDENIALLSGYIDEIKRQYEEVSKKAQESLNKKNEKLRQIKDLETEIELLKSEVSKKNEILEQLGSYKTFVTELTPQESGKNKKNDIIPFKDPSDLHNVILQLEKENLYKIERKQEIEQEHEEIKSQSIQTKAYHAAQRKAMKDMIEHQKKLNEAAQERLNSLHIRKQELEKKALDQGHTLQIEKRIEDLFIGLTHQDNSNVLGAIDQLSELENLLTKYMQIYQDLQKEGSSIFKEREQYLKKERQKINLNRKRQEEEKRDQDKRKLIEKRKNRVIKKGGRKVMFKYKQPENEVQSTKQENQKEDSLLNQFLNEDV